MLKTVEAVIEKDGRLHLLEKIELTGTKRVLVTFLEEDDIKDCHEISETALLSEAAMGEDWNRPEEDEAWQHLR